METLKCCVEGTPQRQLQVDTEMKMMDAAVSRGKELLFALKDRLKPVLNEIPPAPTCEEQGVPNLVPLAHEIMNFRQKVEANNQIVEDILERLEL